MIISDGNLGYAGKLKYMASLFPVLLRTPFRTLLRPFSMGYPTVVLISPADKGCLFQSLFGTVSVMESSWEKAPGLFSSEASDRLPLEREC